VTDAVIEEVKLWQAWPLDELYPIVYLDALMVKVRNEGHICHAHHSLHRSPRINIGQNPLCKGDCIADGAFQRRRWPTVPVRQLSRCKNTGSNQHALAAFVLIPKFSRFAFCSLTTGGPFSEQFRIDNGEPAGIFRNSTLKASCQKGLPSQALPALG
jgi:mutator family transposase